jgi:nitrogen regulatory protein PII-like uncharacterized protein
MEFLATFENTNNDKGDGIKIKLGRKATRIMLLHKSAEKAVVVIGEVDDTKLAIIKNSFTGQMGKNRYSGLVTMGTQPRGAINFGFDSMYNGCRFRDVMIDFS